MDEKEDHLINRINADLQRQRMAEIYGTLKALVGSTDSEFEGVVTNFDFRSNLIEAKLSSVKDDAEGIKELRSEFKAFQKDVSEGLKTSRENIKGLEGFIEQNSPSYASVLEVRVRVNTIEGDISSLRARIQYLEEKRKFSVNVTYTIITLTLSVLTFILGYFLK